MIVKCTTNVSKRGVMISGVPQRTMTTEDTKNGVIATNNAKVKVILESWKASLAFVVSGPFSSKSIRKSNGWLRITFGAPLNLVSYWIDFDDIRFPY